MALGFAIQENTTLAKEAEARCRRLVDRLGPAMVAPRENVISEDYIVFGITELDGATGVPASDHSARARQIVARPQCRRGSISRGTTVATVPHAVQR